MLRKSVKSMTRKAMDLQSLRSEACDIIRRATETSDTSLLTAYFGPDAHQYHLSVAQLEQLKAKEGEMSSFEYFEYLYRVMNTCYLELGLYYACRKGNLPLTEYFMKQQKLSGELMVDVSSAKEDSGIEEKLKGPPIKLAVENGHLDLVQYIYDNSNAMVETSTDQPRKPTLLMRAAKHGHLTLVKYLLEKGANINAETSFPRHTALRMAIRANSPEIVRELIRAGAIVTTLDVNEAILHHASLDIICLLLAESLDQEDPSDPYLITAIQSGDIEIVNFFEQNPRDNNLEWMAPYCDKGIEHAMLVAAARSGSVVMMRYLVEVKRLPLPQLIEQEARKQDEKPLKKGRRTGDKDKGLTLLRAATCYYRKSALAYHYSTANKKVPMLRYLFEDLKLLPSARVLKSLCKDNSSIDLDVTAYLCSHLTTDKNEAGLLRLIATDLNRVSLKTLFKLFNLNLIQKGNPFAKFGKDYLKNISALIKPQSDKLSDEALLRLVKEDKEAAIGALFYYCQDESVESTTTLQRLLDELVQSGRMFKTIDITNCKGETLAKFGMDHRNHTMVQCLLRLDADPDYPDSKGHTLITAALDRFAPKEAIEAILSYAKQISHSLRHACKQWLFSTDNLIILLKHTKGVLQMPVAELVRICVADQSDGLSQRKCREKLIALFHYLSETNARQLVTLLKDKTFCEENKISEQYANEVLTSFKENKQITALSSEEIERRLSGSPLPGVTATNLGLFPPSAAVKQSSPNHPQTNAYHV